MNVGEARTCPRASEISGLVLGRLRPEERSAAELHLAECGICRRLLAAGTESTVRWGSLAGPAPEDDPFVLSPVDPSHYEVGRELARGGMGRILEAWDRRHRRPVAIKVLIQPPAPCNDSRERRESPHACNIRPSCLSTRRVSGKKVFRSSQ